jgi:hypothetical protein
MAINPLILTLLFVVAIEFANSQTIPKCSFYLSYNGGGAYTAEVTDQNGTPLGGQISYKCGENHLSTPYPYSFCIECPPTSTTQYDATLTDLTTNTILVTTSVTCVPPGGNTNYILCASPAPIYTIAFKHQFSLKFTNNANSRQLGLSTKTTGDPHFVGFRGQHFDFTGEKGKYFQIFSDLYVSVNALFGDPTNDHRKNVTYMTSYGFKFIDLAVTISSDTQKGLIIANGVPILLRENIETKLSDCVYAIFRGLSYGKTYTVQLQSNHHTFIISLIDRIWKYLNLDLRIKHDDYTKLGGILGLTAEENFNITNYSNEDFEENNLISISSKYNEYKATELNCSTIDPINTLSPSQLNPVAKRLTLVAQVLHSKFEDIFST